MTCGIVVMQAFSSVANAIAEAVAVAVSNFPLTNGEVNAIAVAESKAIGVAFASAFAEASVFVKVMHPGRNHSLCQNVCFLLDCRKMCCISVHIHTYAQLLPIFIKWGHF